jgi:hypothetical protein
MVIAPRGEDWRAAITWLNEERTSRPLPVIVASGLIEMKNLSAESNPALEDYCLYPVTALYPLDADRNEMAPLILDGQGHITQLIEMLAIHRGGAWLVVRGNRQTAEKIGRGLAGQLTAPGMPAWQARVAASYQGVQLLLIEAEGPPFGRLDLGPQLIRDPHWSLSVIVEHDNHRLAFRRHGLLGGAVNAMDHLDARPPNRWNAGRDQQRIGIGELSPIVALDRCQDRPDSLIGHLSQASPMEIGNPRRLHPTEVHRVVNMLKSILIPPLDGPAQHMRMRLKRRGYRVCHSPLTA